MELSPLSRWLVRATGVLFALLGVVLFVQPAWAAAGFPWKITPFVAMTMGGWYLGSAVVAFEAARCWRWTVIFPMLLALWSFGLLEAGLLVLHQGVLHLTAPLGWPYVVTLAVAALTSLVGIVDRLRRVPAEDDVDLLAPPSHRVGAVAFVVFVAFLGLAGLSGFFGAGRNIFPESLTVLTVRAFGAFYLSLAIGALPLIWTRSLNAELAYSRVGLVWIVLITLAALVYLPEFDFVQHPGGLIYFGIYLLVGIAIAIALRSSRPPKEMAAPRRASLRSAMRMFASTTRIMILTGGLCPRRR